MPAAVVLVALVDTRKEFEDLASTYLPIAIVVFALVLLGTIVPLFLFRSRRAGAASDREEPAWLPIGYAAALVAVVAVLITLTFNAQDKISAKVAHPGLTVDVTAAKWNWRFNYPAQHISQIGGDSTPTTLVVPTGTNIRFNLTSLDVIHSFWIPYVRFKRDAFPRRSTSFVLSFPGKGYHTAGRCAEYCGLKHDQMIFTVQVMSQADFGSWVRQQQAAHAS
ncbi:MAG TPA: cytochrome c oxidase subunit II [Solirubrobacteraceae bacterium]|nr:cytochrome c oxidase subunit II [Solirubrobacteraceae bacterium]